MLVDFSNDGNKYYEIKFHGSSRRAYLTDRDVTIDEVKESVYILMDRRKRCFYIGQTGASDCAGFVNRSAVHKWEKKWWEQALVISDNNGDFKQDQLRRWLEGRLNEIAKKANTSLIFSIGKQNPSDDLPDGDDILTWVLKVCQFLGIPWAYPIENETGAVAAAKQTSKPVKKSYKAWQSRAAACQALVEAYNGGKGKGGVDAILGGRVVIFKGKWRERLEKLGLVFGTDGKMSDGEWKKLPCPLPQS